MRASHLPSPALTTTPWGRGGVSRHGRILCSLLRSPSGRPSRPQCSRRCCRRRRCRQWIHAAADRCMPPPRPRRGEFHAARAQDTLQNRAVRSGGARAGPARADNNTDRPGGRHAARRSSEPALLGRGRRGGRGPAAARRLGGRVVRAQPVRRLRAAAAAAAAAAEVTSPWCRVGWAVAPPETAARMPAALVRAWQTLLSGHGQPLSRQGMAKSRQGMANLSLVRAWQTSLVGAVKARTQVFMHQDLLCYMSSSAQAAVMAAAAAAAGEVEREGVEGWGCQGEPWTWRRP
jgi:hypothetical protein